MRCIRNLLLFYIACRRDVASLPSCLRHFGCWREDVASNVSTVGEVTGGCALPDSRSGCPHESLSLVDRYVLIRIFGAQVIGAGTDQAIVIELFDNMRRPAADARDCEDGREQVNVDAEGVIGGSGIEVDVGVQLLVGLHELFYFVRHFKPLRLPAGFTKIPGHGAEMRSARIFSVIDAMAKP